MTLKELISTVIDEPAMDLLFTIVQYTFAGCPRCVCVGLIIAFPR
ncbi:MAG: hypothetical protein ACTSXS_00340 [Candidatus Thorarchaeota archaeon]